MALDLTLVRFLHGSDSTLGELFVADDFFCFVCEDERRAVKVEGETRIPAGRYQILLREEWSPMNRRYAARFGFHCGMLWLQDVPGFEWVYIHVGNTDDDTAGCLLTGFAAGTCDGGGQVMRSVEAYSELYPVLVEAIQSGVDVFIIVRDERVADGV